MKHWRRRQSRGSLAPAYVLAGTVALVGLPALAAPVAETPPADPESAPKQTEQPEAPSPAAPSESEATPEPESAPPPRKAAADPSPEPPPAARATWADPQLATYMQRLHSAGLLDNREATMAELEAVLRRAQDRYVRGDDLGSATLLFDVLQNPRFASFDGLPVMASVHYHLGVALQSFGAEDSARLAFEHTLAAGPEENTYFRPALRRHVDLTLAAKDFVRGLDRLRATLDGAKVDIGGLPEEDADEIEYLEARALEQRGDLPASRKAHDAVGERSRFHTASLYLRGTIAAHARDYRGAEDAFCRVVGGAENNTSVYYVDGRYFPVRDLAQLGLGRVAHEERRHGHAFYHYFQVPQESEHLPSALFESAWTMAEEGEYGVARGLIKELRERFPDAPQTVESQLLDAMLLLYDCDFRTAEAAFTKFIEDMGPVADHVDELRTDPARVRELHRQLTALRASADDLRGELPAHRLLLYMVDDDPAYARLSHRAAVLRREGAFAAGLERELETLRGRLRGEDISADTLTKDRLAPLEKVAELEVSVAALDRQLRRAEAAGADPDSLAAERNDLGQMRAQLEKLRSDAAALARALPEGGVADTGDVVSAVEHDIDQLTRTRLRANAVAAELDDEAAKLAAARLGHLRLRIGDLMGEARMGRIDAVLGAKKKLEIEVQSMAAGRFPSELFGKLQIEGMVGDDEEFWPYEGEYWADEYEGYR